MMRLLRRAFAMTLTDRAPAAKRVHPPGRCRARLFQLVAGGDDARVAHDVDQNRALHEGEMLLVLEEDERAVLPGGDVARDLPAVVEKLLDGDGSGLLGVGCG